MQKDTETGGFQRIKYPEFQIQVLQQLDPSTVTTNDFMSNTSTLHTQLYVLDTTCYVFLLILTQLLSCAYDTISR